MAQVFDVTVTVTKNNLPMLKARGKRKAQTAVRQAAHNTWRYSRPIARKDTGAMATGVAFASGWPEYGSVCGDTSSPTRAAEAVSPLQ